MRVKLEKFLNRTINVIGTYANAGERGYHIVLIDIFDIETGEYLTDHIWLDKRDFSDFELVRGDIFRFEGKVERYSKGHLYEDDNLMEDLKITNISKIQKVFSIVKFLEFKRTLIKQGKLKPLETIREHTMDTKFKNVADLPLVLTIQDLAKLFQVHPRTINRKLLDGTIKGFRIDGKNWRVNKSEVMRIIEES